MRSSRCGASVHHRTFHDQPAAQAAWTIAHRQSGGGRGAGIPAACGRTSQAWKLSVPGLGRPNLRARFHTNCTARASPAKAPLALRRRRFESVRAGRLIAPLEQMSPILPNPPAPNAQNDPDRVPRGPGLGAPRGKGGLLERHVASRYIKVDVRLRCGRCGQTHNSTRYPRY